jgi:alkanesulfonate monooxygenase SsuD/methylene tetrahydromethanopterin reductase-like flavin-dependent oxidoreductase (luciferase family)
LQQPRVPLLIAGGGERVTLRQVAQYADACNFGPSGATGNAWGLDDVRRKYGVLREHCARIGRPFESVLRTFHSLMVMAETEAGVQARLDARAGGRPRVEAPRAAAMPREIHTYFDMPGLEKVPLQVVAGTPEQVTAYFRLLVDAGVQYIIVPGRDAETVRLLAENVMPHFNDS